LAAALAAALALGFLARLDDGCEEDDDERHPPELPESSSTLSPLTEPSEPDGAGRFIRFFFFRLWRDRWSSFADDCGDSDCDDSVVDEWSSSGGGADGGGG